MAEASGIMYTSTNLIPGFKISSTIQRTHLGLGLGQRQLTVSRKQHIHYSVSASASATGASASASASATATQVSAMETIPWGCEIDSLENASAFQRWLSESGLPPQKMTIQRVDVGERGLVALKNVRKGEKLLFVPPALVITADSVSLSFLPLLPL